MIVPKKNEEMARALGCREQNFRWDSPTLDPPIWVSNEREASGELVCFCQNLRVVLLCAMRFAYRIIMRCLAFPPDAN
jgi:hypothetical protein